MLNKIVKVLPTRRMLLSAAAAALLVTASPILPGHEAKALKLEGKPKIAFIYAATARDGGWNEALDNARMAVEKELGAKIAVVDGGHGFVGSSNMDALSWRRNAELDLVFHDEETVSHLADLWFADSSVSDEITLESHRQRGVLHRAFERFAGLFDDWL